MNSKKLLSTVLVIIGAIILLDFVGIHLGGIIRGIIGFLVPFIFIAFGVVAWRYNRRGLAVVLVVIGAFILLGKLSGLITLLVAIGLIVWGLSMFRGKRGR
ncbi:LiaF transmembrane domain-containing protein [Paenibacillus protaetiae]|uniref:LiaF transmembrane domain-containing protein n=1 Tax=Paenibacillus protaetiae TaxID=2509456 RepID=A0A4P6F1A8_9BACL|nr:hypothetical protein [Paenibacillus protaetiae]QAY66817.1 hypothetical protein ET464_10755 [Paenibacillus protaetiae]